MCDRKGQKYVQTIAWFHLHIVYESTMLSECIMNVLKELFLVIRETIT